MNNSNVDIVEGRYLLLIGVVINTFCLCVLITGFVIGFILDLGSFRRKPEIFIIVGLILIATIIFYGGVSLIQYYNNKKGVKKC